MFNLEELRQILDYAPDTGIFTWKKVRYNHQHLLGKPAGSIYDNGYRYIQIAGKAYKSGRLAWFFMTGLFPPDFVEHANTIKSDDTWNNLRLATNSQNQANRGPPSNNTSGYKGVSWQPSRGKWMARIMVDGKAKNLGRYDTKEEAACAYAIAADKIFGMFARM